MHSFVLVTEGPLVQFSKIWCVSNVYSSSVPQRYGILGLWTVQYCGRNDVSVAPLSNNQYADIHVTALASESLQIDIHVTALASESLQLYMLQH